LDYSYNIGDFVWTGMDYLGEASIGWRGFPQNENYYPWHLAYCGDIDICGFKRPQSYYRDVLWNVGKQLSIFVKPPEPSFPVKDDRIYWSKWHWHDHVADWNWEGYEKEPLEVIVYSAYEKVELFLNGISLGEKSTNATNERMAKWKVPYEKGELKAMATNMDGTMISTILRTAEKPTEITMASDRNTLVANGQDLSFIALELLDENGIRNPKSDSVVKFEIDGPGEIVALGSANPISTESFKQNKRKAYKGRCLVIIKSGKKEGDIVLKATSEGCITAELTIKVKR
jgi:beta-galactosidase